MLVDQLGHGVVDDAGEVESDFEWAVPEAIIAEIGVDTSRFPTAKHLASWAPLCPGNNESAGKRRSGATGALAARQAGSLLVGRGRELTVGQYAEHWLAGFRKWPTTRARYRQALADVIGDDRRGNLALTKLRPQY